MASKGPKDIPFPASGDHVRDGIQKYLNDIYGNSMLVHYVVLAGVQFPTEKGWETKPILFADSAQPDYVTDGLLAAASDLRDQEVLEGMYADAEVDDDDSDGEPTAQ